MQHHVCWDDIWFNGLVPNIIECFVKVLCIREQHMAHLAMTFPASPDIQLRCMPEQLLSDPVARTFVCEVGDML